MSDTNDFQSTRREALPEAAGSTDYRFTAEDYSSEMVGHAAAKGC